MSEVRSLNISRIDDSNREPVVERLRDRSAFHSWFSSLATGSFVVIPVFGSKPGFSIVLLAVAALFAPVAHSGAGWTDYAKIAELVPTARHYYVFRLPVENNPSGCREDAWFYQNYDALGSERMFDALLEGIKSGLRLRVYVTGVCNLDGYAEISSVGIIP